MTNREFDNFDSAMRKLIAVPHEKIKAKLDAEKRARERKKKRKSKTSAGGRAVGGKG